MRPSAARSSVSYARQARGLDRHATAPSRALFARRCLSHGNQSAAVTLEVMIVDLGLREANGIAAVKEILRGEFVRHVFVTGDTVRGMPLGAGAVLLREPFRVSELVPRKLSCGWSAS